MLSLVTLTCSFTAWIVLSDGHLEPFRSEFLVVLFAGDTQAVSDFGPNVFNVPLTHVK